MRYVQPAVASVKDSARAQRQCEARGTMNARMALRIMTDKGGLLTDSTNHALSSSIRFW